MPLKSYEKQADCSAWVAAFAAHVKESLLFFVIHYIHQLRALLSGLCLFCSMQGKE